MFKYKFIAHYNDGTKYEQNDADVSNQDPKRSCFYDVEHEKLQSFELKDKDENSLIVFLNDGHFEFLHKTGGILIPAPPGFENLTNFRVIFFRTHEASPTTGIDKIVCYKLGFQANDSRTGQNVQTILELY